MHKKINQIPRHVEFRFDLGGGPVTLRSPSPLVPGQWHRVVFKRYHQDGMIQVRKKKLLLKNTVKI